MDTNSAARPWHLWVVGVLGTLWNSGGAIDYTMSNMHNASYMAAFTPEQLSYFDSFPAWATGFWALGVWGAFVGSLLLLFRSRRAVPAFAIAMIGLAGVTAYQMTTPALPESFKTASSIGFTATIWIATALLLWYAVRMRRSGILR